MRSDQTPPFYDLGEYAFQGLCRDLFDVEPGIATCDVYGTRGQCQKGIDLLAQRRDADGIDVGQCKCCATFSAQDVRSASDRFLEHWDSHWQALNVKRFVLFVASDLERTQVQDAILQETVRFAKYGVVYQAWSAAKIRNKLRSQPAIAQNYLPEDLVRDICGETTSLVAGSLLASQSTVLVSSVLGEQLQRTASWASTEIERQMAVQRSAWREGRRTEALQWVVSVREDGAVWTVLSPEAKAGLLCFQAGLELDCNGDTARARCLLDEACALAPAEGQVRVRALLAYRQEGLEPALTELGAMADVNSLTLRSALLLETGDIAGCESTLGRVAPDARTDPEVFRLTALLHLAKGEIGRARLNVQKALELAPRWESVRMATTRINYFGALSPAARQNPLAAWPEPVDWALVRRDDEAAAGLCLATDILAELARDTERKPPERQLLEAWRLACLSNHPDRQEEAIQFCRDLLQTNPTHHQAIAWAAARNFPVDLGPSERALKRLLKERPTPADIIARVICCIVMGRSAKAITLLERTRSVFGRAGSDALWVLWYAQALAAGGRGRAALDVLADAQPAPELDHIRSLALQRVGESAGTQDELVEHLQASYSRTGDPRFLLDYFRSLASRREWSELAERAEELVEKVGTGDALGLAASAACNAGCYALCLRLLDQHRGLFGQGKLPAHLRRMQVLCRQRLGSLPQAIREAESIARESPTIENKLALCRLYALTGDMNSVCVIARRLLDSNGLPVDDALQLARLLAWEDRAVAVSLWRFAAEQGIPDGLVGMAVAIGFQLGLEREMGPIQERMAALGRSGRGGIQVFTLEQYVAFAHERREEMTRVEELYLHGNIPVHFAAGSHDLPPLVVPYHLLLETNAVADSAGRSPVFIRHGSRLLPPGFEESRPQWRLNLDVTAVLLAAHLGVLDAVERAFAPLCIPQDLIPALIEMRDGMLHRQPSRLDASRQIVELVDSGLLGVVEHQGLIDGAHSDLVAQMGERWVALLGRARRSNGYLVDYLPLHRLLSDDPPTGLPDDTAKLVANCRAVVEALRAHGPLSDSAYSDAVNALGEEGTSLASQAAPTPGATLLLYGNVADTLAAANLLRTVCSRFDTSMERRELDRVKLELLAQDRRQSAGNWLSELISRLRDGLSASVYETISALPDRLDRTEGQLPWDAASRCLLSLMKFEPRGDDVIWCDDRYITGYVRRDAVPIIGVNEVLRALVAAQVIDEAAYYSRLTALRAGDARFIPLDRDEVLHHLRQARVESGAVKETCELSALRRYTAVCLLQSQLLQRAPCPDGSGSKYGEIAFVLAQRRATRDVLQAVWTDEDEDEPTRAARADWIADALYMDRVDLLLGASPGRPEDNGWHAVAVGLAELVIEAIALPTGGGSSPRRLYLSWVYDRILWPRFDAEPGLIGLVTGELVSTIVNLAQDVAPNERDDIRVVLRKFHEDVPAPVRQALESDAEYLAHLGMKHLNVVMLGDLEFALDEFNSAAAEAVSGRRASIATLARDVSVTFEPLDDRRARHGFQFVHPITGDRVVAVDAKYALYLESAAEREAGLRADRSRYDCCDETFERLVAEVAAAPSASQRMEKAEHWQAQSTSVYYGRLVRKVSRRVPIGLPDFLPPSGDGLLRYLRLAPETLDGSEFKQVLAKAASVLANEEGLALAIERMAGIPAPIPEPLMRVVETLDSDAALELVRRLIRAGHSPISQIHFARILLRLTPKVKGARRLSRHVLRHLLGDRGARELTAFLSILRWTDQQFSTWPDASNWPAHIRLALEWTHAHGLFRSMARGGASAEWVRQVFADAQVRTVPALFELDADHWFDVANPRRADRATLLLTGLAYAFEDEGWGTIDAGLRRLLRDAVVVSSEHGEMPDPGLFRDPSLASNGLCSFLGMDRAEALSPLFGSGEVECFTARSLALMAREAIAGLTDPEDALAAWVSLHMVLGDLPPQDDLAAPLAAALAITDYGALFDSNQRIGLLALQTATRQAMSLRGEGLHSHLRDALVAVARHASARFADHAAHGVPEGCSANPEEAAGMLLESALALSVAIAHTPDDATVQFGEMVRDLASIWQAQAAIFRTVVQRLYERLPPAQAKHLARLLVQLRAQ